MGAGLAGSDVKVLLQKCLPGILGSALPYKETGDAQERALANTVTAGGLLLKHLTGKLELPSLLCHSLGHLRLLCVCTPAPCMCCTKLHRPGHKHGSL